MRTRGSTQWTKPCEALLTDLRCPSFKTGHCLTKPPAFRLFQRGRWQAERQNDILEQEGLQLRGAEDHRMDIAAWLHSLGLERYVSAFRDNEIDWGCCRS